ncbi:MAG: hypothetical protein E5X19_24765, partial [Mesorhizobium sp.]
MDAAVDAGTGQFELTEQQRAMKEMAEAFAADRVAPNALDWDRAKHFPADVIRETGPLGLGGIYVRDDVGGSALGRLDAVLIFEALAHADPAFSSFISIHNMAASMIDRFGGDGPKGISTLVVPKDAPGLSFGANEHKMGWHMQSTRQVIFEDCKVPAENLLATEGAGFGIAMAGLDGGR